jgi:hypothetical protein
MDIKVIKQKVLGDKESWMHTFGHTWRILLIIVALSLIWRAFSPPKNTTVNVGSGGKAIINQAPKRFFIPFIEGGVEKNSNTAYDTYVRAGLRFEF